MDFAIDYTRKDCLSYEKLGNKSIENLEKHLYRACRYGWVQAVANFGCIGAVLPAA